MTENEKLRALLAEALTWMRECDCHTKLLSPKDDAFLARIDAALAEPLRPAVATYPWVADENEKIHQRDAERVVDEARAEVEYAYREGGALYEAKIAQSEAEHERDEARAEVGRLTQRIAALENALASISLDEYESTSSASEKVHGHARTARKALYGEEKP
jgi:hypothetical protein